MASDNDWCVPSLYEEDSASPAVRMGRGDIEAELVQFREQWCQELSNSRQDAALTEGHGDGLGEGHQEALQQHDMYPSTEEEARYLFLQGVHAEQSHKLYDAILYYRRAVQLVPDIEFRITDYGDTNANKRYRQESESSVDSLNLGEEEDLSNLSLHFSKLSTNTICVPGYDQGAAHISDLPSELIQLILKWVVSTELDVMSLERVAMVSRGFYLAARDEDIWRLICERVWGRNCGSMKQYGSWRNMYMNRQHLQFNGCFISKMSYFRQGERSLDNFYKPFHLVEYYRYIRFFPDGKVLMLTTPDDPYSTVSELKSRHARVQGLLTGYYKLSGNQVTAVLTRVTQPEKQVYRYKRKQRSQDKNEMEQLFYVEFTVRDGSRGRQNQRLSWVQYSIRTKYKATGQESVANIDLTEEAYPSLSFSRVKSYTAEASRPLSAK